MADIFELFKKIGAQRDAQPPQLPLTHLIVGLGNPGAQYFDTRHNSGFLMMDYLSQRCGARVDRAKFNALVGEATIREKRVLLMKPQTYMNASGDAVAAAASFYKIPVQNILVFSDDISLDVGRVRVRRRGSDGGQKGLRSIIERMGSDDFPRIRFGVGEKPSPDFPLADWVLSRFGKQEKERLFAAFERAYEGVGLILAGDVDAAMQLCNGK